MIAVFAAAIFLSSALLFWLEPLFGKMVLPLLGGAPPVWNACILFYQVALLGGYAWANAADRIGTRRHMLIHVAISIATLGVLPFAVPQSLLPPSVDRPLAWLFGVLGVGVGLPFVVIAANGPLLQRAFSRSDPTQSRNPYLLYAASNLGSAIALLLYPVVFERFLTLTQQTYAWGVAYIVMVGLVLLCAVITLRGGARPGITHQWRSAPPLPWLRRLRWMVLAAIPSSLMLGVTSYISAEIAPVPLIWILPLALYLATLVAAFAATDRLSSWISTIFSGAITGRAILGTLASLALLAAVGAALWLAWGPRPTVVVAHLLLFAFAALLCHVRLAADRPAPAYLTEYYLWLAIGGGVGGMFNTLVGPLLFTSVLEYPLALAAVIMVLPSRAGEPGRGLTRADLAWPLAIGIAAAAVPLLIRVSGVALPFPSRLLLAVPALAALAFSGRPVRFGGTLMAVIAASAAYPSEIGSIEYATRNFYSVHRILRDDRHGFRWLTNGVTVHGGQRLADALAPLPLTYYTPSGPAGDAFRALARPGQRVGVIGLGAGALMHFASPGERWRFFEIDPAVNAIAHDTRFFTFLGRAKAPYDVIEGDARLSLARDSMWFDILVLDAFSSDAVPVHLLTREAIRVYESRLRPGGVVLMHISNRFYDLGPIVGVMARDAGLAALQRQDLDPDDMEVTGKFGSHWVALSRDGSRIEPLRSSGWESLTLREMRVWTDDFSSVLPLLRTRAHPAGP
jgi:hypothetical protein